MRLKQIVIENYKAFERLEFLPTPDATIILGINGAGKTSLAEAIRLLGELTQGSDTRWLKTLFLTRARRGFIDCLPWGDRTRTMRFTIMAVDEDGVEIEYRLALAEHPSGDPSVVEEEFRVGGEVQVRWDPEQSGWVSNGKILMSVAPGYSIYPFILNFILYRGMFPPLPPRPSRFTRWMDGWRELRPEPLDAGRAWEHLDPARHVEIARRGENYAAVLFNWKNSLESKDRWEFVYESTQTLLAALGLKLEWDVRAIPLGGQLLVQPWVWPKGESPERGFDLTYGPDGLRQWLMVLTALCSPAWTVLVIEEPELHLDPRMMDLLVEAMQEAIDKWGDRQLVVTTHSPFFASRWPVENLRLIRQGRIIPVPEGLAADLREKRIRLHEAWMMDMLIGEFVL